MESGRHYDIEQSKRALTRRLCLLTIKRRFISDRSHVQLASNDNPVTKSHCAKYNISYIVGRLLWSFVPFNRLTVNDRTAIEITTVMCTITRFHYAKLATNPSSSTEPRGRSAQSLDVNLYELLTTCSSFQVQ